MHSTRIESKPSTKIGQRKLIMGASRCHTGGHSMLFWRKNEEVSQCSSTVVGSRNNAQYATRAYLGWYNRGATFNLQLQDKNDGWVCCQLGTRVEYAWFTIYCIVHNSVICSKHKCCIGNLDRPLWGGTDWSGDGFWCWQNLGNGQVTVTTTLNQWVKLVKNVRGLKILNTKCTTSKWKVEASLASNLLRHNTSLARYSPAEADSTSNVGYCVHSQRYKWLAT